MSNEPIRGDDASLARKLTTVLFGAQSLVSAALLAGGTVSAIAGAQLIGSPAWAGVPSAVQQLGTAFAALAVSFALDRLGRRWGLVLGVVAGVLGAGMAATAVASSDILGKAIGAGSLALFLGGLALMGAAMAAMRLGRFVAASVHPPQRRGRAISHVVAGGAVGAIIGPLLVGPSGRWALEAGLNELTGPFVIALVILALATAVLLIWLRPDPRDLGERIAQAYPETIAHPGPARSILQILSSTEALVAVSAMVIAQTVMVVVMVITSLHMKSHHHTLTDISLVIAAHTLGMYAFSVVSGRVTDRWGRGPVILLGAGMLISSCVLAPLSPNVFPLAVCLFVLGLGWNLCYVGGSTLLSDHLSNAERAKVQGVNDWLMSLVTAGGTLASGWVFAGSGYAALGTVAALVSLVPLGLTAWWMIASRRECTTLVSCLRAARWQDGLHLGG